MKELNIDKLISDTYKETELNKIVNYIEYSVMLAEDVMLLKQQYPNDREFGEAVRELVNRYMTE